MGIRLKILLTIFLFIFLYAFYYLGIPHLINPEKFNPQIEQYAYDKFGFKVKIDKPSLKMGLTPTIWLKAQNFYILNEDNSYALEVKNPCVQVALIPLIFNRYHIKYFSSDNIVANLYSDSKYRFRLGDYMLFRMSNFIFKLDRAKIHQKKYEIHVYNEYLHNHVCLKGDYIKIDKIIPREAIKTTFNSTITTKNRISKVYADIDVKIPFRKNFKKFTPEMSLSITNLDLADISNLVQFATKGNISDLSGVLNIDFHSDKKISDQKEYYFNLALSKFGFNSKYIDKPFNYNDKIQLKSLFLLNKNRCNIASFVFKTNKIVAKFSGQVDNLTSNNHTLDLCFKMFNVKSKDVLDLLPYSKYFDKLLKINYSVAKSSNFNSDLDVYLKIKGKSNKPKVDGKVELQHAYIGYPIKNAPQGAYILLKYKENVIKLNSIVPIDANQNFSVIGFINSEVDDYVDLKIKSTNFVNLATVERLLGPIQQTFNFPLGPFPIMGFDGHGNIDIKIVGTKSHPTCNGVFNIINSSINFDDIKNLVLKNANASLKFEDDKVDFNLKNGTVNGKKVTITGKSDLSGNFDFKVNIPNQDLGDMLIVLKNSPMLKDFSGYVKNIADAKGYTTIDLRLYGKLLDIKEYKLFENVHTKGNIHLDKTSVKLVGTTNFVKNIFGNIKFNDANMNIDIVSKFNSTNFNLTGTLKNNNANVVFDTSNLRLADIINLVKIPNIAYMKSKEDKSLVTLKGSYKGSITDINLANAKIDGNIIFRNFNLAYLSPKIPIKINNGQVSVKNTKLFLKKLDSTLGTMPLDIEGTIEDYLSRPKVLLHIKGTPNQKFADYAYNKNSIYPIKVRGNITLTSRVSGYLDRLNLKTNLKFDGNSSIYYMGVTVGGQNAPLIINSDIDVDENRINVKSLYEDRLVLNKNNKYINSRQITSSGQIYTTSNSAVLKDFKVKTSVPTDMKIFNIIFKKPLIKKGLCTMDLVINGNILSPKIRGTMDMLALDIPFLDTTIKNVSMKFQPENILAKIQCDFMSNSIEMSINAKNRLTPPYIMNSGLVQAKFFDLDMLITTLNRYELEAVKNKFASDSGLLSKIAQNNSKKTNKIVDLNQIKINNLKLKAETLNFYDINAENLDADCSLNNGELKLEKFSYNLANGIMTGSLSTNINNKKSKIKLSVKDVDANDLFTNFFNVKDQLYGKLDGNLNLSCIGVITNKESCLKSLNGSGQFIVSDGKMPKLGSLEYLLRAGNLLKSGVTGLSINSIINLVTPLKTGNFSSIKGTVTLNNGVAKDVKILSTGKNMSIFVTGDYDLSSSIANMYVFGRLSRKVPSLLGPLGNVSLNSFFNAIPGIDLTQPENAKVLNEVNKIPGLELSSKLYRVFAVEIHGDISGNDFVDSFRWVE